MRGGNSIPTQELLEVETIKEGVLILRDGSLKQVLAVDGINVDLFSAEEREVLVLQFQRFLNTLDFPLEFVVHSRRLNLDQYKRQIEEKMPLQKNELLAALLKEYLEFLNYLESSGNVMRKDFFVVVGYTSPIITEKNLFSWLPFKKNKNVKPVQNEDFEKKKFQLERRVEIVKKGLEGLNLEVVALGTEELIRLLYNLYNPDFSERETVSLPSQKKGF